MSSQPDAIVNLLASRFIQRKDARAIQHIDGKWSPDTVTGKRDGQRLPWDREALTAHVVGEKTYGHYLLDQDNLCKFFAFDVDLNKSGMIPASPYPGILPREGDPWASDEEIKDWENSFVATDDLRAVWCDRSHIARPYIKTQFREIAHLLAKGVYENLGLPVAAAYSGAKGIHVYAFTGPISAADAREGSRIVLDALGDFSLVRGINFYSHSRFPNLGIEVFPKQDSLDGKDLGNLLRLPLGKNLKNPDDPTFFIDLTSPMNVLKPVDSEFALTTNNPWKSAS